LLNNNRKQVIASQISPLPQAVLRHIKKYMEENLQDNLSLDELARETNYSRGHFLRMFRAATGRPPHRYLMERRIELAKSMLLAEGMSLIDIAARCGFSSQSHLTRVFRKQIGVTPSVFKRRSELKDLV
jgi:AraC family transcriptional regulator